MTPDQIAAQRQAELQYQIDKANENLDFYRSKPGDIQYSPGYDPKTMGMMPELQMKLDALNMDKRGLDKFRLEALRQGPSAWAKLARKDQALQAMDARERGAEAARGQSAQAMDDLASRGGLTSGARERIATEGAKNYLNMGQNVARQQNQNNLQIGMNDEQNRITQLSQLPGMEVQAMQPDFQKLQLWGQGRQFDVGNQINENKSKNAFDMGQYEQKMKAWAADRQAQATEKAGK
jgi:hypothetical protein